MRQLSLIHSALAGFRALLPWESCGHKKDGYGSLSIIAATMLAWRLGAMTVDLLGCNWSGVLDFDGVTPLAMRTDRRWARERLLVAIAVEMLCRHGVTCRRLDSEGTDLPLYNASLKSRCIGELWRLMVLLKRDDSDTAYVNEFDKRRRGHGIRLAG